jgi:hypothetical protein
MTACAIYSFGDECASIVDLHIAQFRASSSHFGGRARRRARLYVNTKCQPSIDANRRLRMLGLVLKWLGVGA